MSENLIERYYLTDLGEVRGTGRVHCQELASDISPLFASGNANFQMEPTEMTLDLMDQ